MGGACLGWERLLLAHRPLVLNVASYGWVGRFLFPVKSSSLLSPRASARARWPPQAFASSFMGPFVLVSRCSLEHRMRTALDRGQDREWHDQPWSSLGHLRRALKEQGWVVHRSWVWRLPQPWYSEAPGPKQALDLRASSVQGPQQQLHALRAQFRRQAFTSYINSDRHEVVELLSHHSFDNIGAGFPSSPCPAHSRRFKPCIGLWCWGRASHLNNLCRTGKEDESGSCHFWNSPNGLWKHVMWHCPLNRPGVQIPVNPLASRLG